MNAESMNDITISERCVPGLRCINSLHSPEVADALRSVAQVLAFLVNPEGCLFITQVLLQLVLGCSI